MEIISHSEKQTAQAAQELAKTLPSQAILLLHGNLGAGKSLFARSLIRALVGQNDLQVPSPTFTLVQTYSAKDRELWHFDLYRLEDPEEIYELGWEDAILDTAIIEWPERLGPLKPKRYIDIHIESVENEANKRIITIHHIE